MFDDVRTVARALDVHPGLLLWGVLGGFGLLCLSAVATSSTVTIASCAFGAGLLGVGARAIYRPSRPFDLSLLKKTPANMDYINTTRRVGGFYVLVGIVWTVLSLSVSVNS